MREDAILNPIMIQDLSLIVVVSVLAPNVLASSWVRWCCTYLTGGPVGMLCAIAVVAVPASSGCLSLDVLAPARGDIGVSDPRAF